MRRALLVATTSILLCSFIDINSAYYHKKMHLSTSIKSQSLFSYSEPDATINNKKAAISNTTLIVKENEQLARLQRIKPNPAGYTRVDESFLDDSVKDLFTFNDHALHDSLNGPNKIEVYDVFKKNDSDEIVCLIKFGKSLNGYPGIVHGGITALLFDNTFGWVFLALKAPHGVTANLNINYRYVLVYVRMHLYVYILLIIVCLLIIIIDDR